MKSRHRSYLFSLISITLFISCTSKPGAADTTSVKFDQYYIKGEQLYLSHCSNCHQPGGTGLGLVYPPLHKSDYMDKNFERVLCLMKHGISGEVMVNGKSYIQPMPGVSSLTDLEIAEIATYIYNTWEHKRGIVDVTEVSKVMNTCVISN
jgi:cytochrome c551